MADIGQSFSPTSASAQMMNRPGAPANPVMDAIKILSLRIPQVVGAGAGAPQGLLAGLGGVAPQGNDAALIQQWLQRFFGGQLGQPGAPPMGMPQAGPPPMGAPPQPGRPSVQFPQAAPPRMPMPEPVGMPGPSDIQGGQGY